MQEKNISLSVLGIGCVILLSMVFHIMLLDFQVEGYEKRVLYYADGKNQNFQEVSTIFHSISSQLQSEKDMKALSHTLSLRGDKWYYEGKYQYKGGLFHRSFTERLIFDSSGKLIVDID